MSVKDLVQKIAKRNQKVLVYGLGLSGIEATLALSRLGVSVIALEEQAKEFYCTKGKFKDRIAELETAAEGLYFMKAQDLPDEILDSIGLCIQSPGVPFDSPLSKRLKDRDIPISNELEFGLSFFDVPKVIITGSIGKSTVSSLTHQLLHLSGRRALLCGNIGMTISSHVQPFANFASVPAPYDFLVVEASSYQLESAGPLSAHIAVLLNVTENHIERHGSLMGVLRAKARIFWGQSSRDFAIYSNQVASLFEDELSAKVLRYGTGSEQAGHAGSFYDSARDEIVLKGENMQGSISCTDFPLLGQHNRLNLAVAVLIARLCGCSTEQLQKALSDLKALEHRLERVSECDAVILNDSKSTTANSSSAALMAVQEKYPQATVHLLCGGVMKSGQAQLEQWKLVFQRLQAISGSQLFLFGQDAAVLAEIASETGLSPWVYQGMRQAVASAQESASQGQVLLFSPGCASFDEFTDFEQRGNVFKSLVRA